MIKRDLRFTVIFMYEMIYELMITIYKGMLYYQLYPEWKVYIDEEDRNRNKWLNHHRRPYHPE